MRGLRLQAPWYWTFWGFETRVSAAGRHSVHVPVAARIVSRNLCLHGGFIQECRGFAGSKFDHVLRYFMAAVLEGKVVII